MGLDCPAVKFLCFCKNSGVDFDKTLTLGRQSFFPKVSTLKEVFNSLKLSESPLDFLERNEFAEEFFKKIGAYSVDSIDASAYESATFVHDLNKPAPVSTKQKYSVVYDGGTLEHVFNLTTAFKNCMDFLKVGGHFIQCSVANNFMGHGFWQFSPELIYRIFSESNGFRVKTMLLYEFTASGRWYAVFDPDRVKERVLLCNSKPTYVLTVAEKIKNADVFNSYPIQSDYSKIWQHHSAGPQTKQISFEQSGIKYPSLRARVKSCLCKNLPHQVVLFLRALNRVRLTHLKLMRQKQKVSWIKPNTVAFKRTYFKRLNHSQVISGCPFEKNSS